MKIFGLEIFVDFWSLMLVALIGASIGEDGVAATLVRGLTGSGNGVAVATLVEGSAGDGSAVSAARRLGSRV